MITRSSSDGNLYSLVLMESSDFMLRDSGSPSNGYGRANGVAVPIGNGDGDLSTLGKHSSGTVLHLNRSSKLQRSCKARNN